MRPIRELFMNVFVGLPCMLLIGLPAFLIGYAWWWARGAFKWGWMVAHEEGQ